MRCSEVVRLRHCISVASTSRNRAPQQKFDLIVLSSLNDHDLRRNVNFSDGAEVLVLNELVMPAELLSVVAQRLNRQQRA